MSWRACLSSVAEREFCRHGSDEENWAAWGATIRSRARSLSEDFVVPALFWGVSVRDGEPLETLLETSREGSLVLPDVFTISGALAAVDLAWKLGRHAGHETPSNWCELLEQLLNVITDANTLSPDDSPLLYQVLCGELPLTLAVVLPDLRVANALTTTSRAAFDAGMDVILDGGGVPRSDHLALLRPLLACWTRSLALAQHAGKTPWSRAAQQQYAWAVEQVLRLTRPDGTLVLSPAAELCQDEIASTISMLEVALPLSGDASDIDAALLVLPRQVIASRRRDSVQRDTLPEVSYHSEWGSVSVARSGWDLREPSITITTPPINATHVPLIAPNNQWSDETFLLELSLHKATLLSGVWSLGVAPVGDAPLAVTEHWTQTGSITESTYDYLEWELQLAGGVRVERQVVLAHDAEVLLLADTVIVPSNTAFNFASSLPLFADSTATQERDATELVLSAANKPLARVMPLFLPEWRKSSSQGKLDVLAKKNSPSQLITRWNNCTATCFLPLFFDLSKSRIKRPYTWRSLTVGENLAAVAASQAVGFRVACGDDQFLLYRSHTEPRNRTVLGHNLVSDLLLATFSPETGVDVIAEIGLDE